MIRLTALYLLMVFLLGYSWKDWYRGVCGLVLLMIVMEHPDMPKSILDIPGLNPFNILLANNVMAWMAARRKEGLTWDMPAIVTAFLAAYAGMILLGWMRAFVDLPDYLEQVGITRMSLIQEELINTMKWVVPALMLYDGCRSEERFRMALASTLLVYLGLAVLTIKTMPLGALTMGGDELQHVALRVLNSNVGYHRVNLSVMFAGAGWAFMACRGLMPAKRDKLLILGAFFVILYAQALTAGRAGYLACALIGLGLSVIKWRKQLIILPIAITLVLTFAPSVTERLMTGITSESSGDVEVDEAELTADRALIWPMVLELIQAKPFEGWGRLGLMRSGVSLRYFEQYGEFFQHPHNAYFELLVDNGILGALIVVPFHLLIVWWAFRLFLDKQNPTYVAAGGAAMTLTMALIIGGVSSQTFYPREGAIGMWCAIGLMLRVRVQRQRALAGSSNTFARTAARAPRTSPVTARPRHRERPAARRGVPLTAPAVATAETPAIPARPSRHARVLSHSAQAARTSDANARKPSKTTILEAWLQPGTNQEFWAA